MLSSKVDSGSISVGSLVLVSLTLDHLVLLVSGKSFDMFVLDINEVDYHQGRVRRGQTHLPAG